MMSFGQDTQTHIVDQLIEERALKLRANRRVWPWVKRIFYPLLGYQKAVSIADRLAPLGGVEAMNWSQDYLDLTTQVNGLDKVPETGACVVTANHPGGIADGIAVWQALKTRRPDIVFFANRDAIRVCQGLDKIVIPVEWRDGERSMAKSRETLKQVMGAFKDGRCIVVFPAGRMSKWDWRKFRLAEEPWQSSAVSLARKFKAPIVPMGVKQRMSLLFYGLGQLHEELRHMTVFHELLAKKGSRYTLSFADPLDELNLPDDDETATQALKEMSESLAQS